MTDLVTWFSSQERWHEARALAAMERDYDQEPFGCCVPSMPLKDEKPVLAPSEIERARMRERELEINNMVAEWVKKVRTHDA